MRSYAVMLHEPNTQVVERLKSTYENVYEFSDSSLLVKTADLAEDIAVVAGIKGDRRMVNGVVFKLNAVYAGFTFRSLWDWLGDEE